MFYCEERQISQQIKSCEEIPLWWEVDLSILFPCENTSTKDWKAHTQEISLKAAFLCRTHSEISISFLAIQIMNIVFLVQMREIFTLN